MKEGRILYFPCGTLYNQNEYYQLLFITKLFSIAIQYPQMKL